VAALCVLCMLHVFCVLESENERERERPLLNLPFSPAPSPTHGLDVFTIKLLDRFSSTLDMTNVWRGKPRPRTFYGNGDRFTDALPTAPNTHHSPSPTFRLARLPTEPNPSFHTSRHTCATPALEALSDSYIPLHTLRAAKCDLSASLLLESVIGCSLSARFVSCVRLIQRERKKALTYSPSLYSTIAPPTQYISLCFFCTLSLSPSLPLSVIHCAHHLSTSQSLLSQSPSPDTAPTVYQSTAYRHAPPPHTQIHPETITFTKNSFYSLSCRLRCVWA
jgi:hypothetical protein